MDISAYLIQHCEIVHSLYHPYTMIIIQVIIKEGKIKVLNVMQKEK